MTRHRKDILEDRLELEAQRRTDENLAALFAILQIGIAICVGVLLGLAR